MLQVTILSWIAGIIAN